MPYGIVYKFTIVEPNYLKLLESNYLKGYLVYFLHVDKLFGIHKMRLSPSVF